MKRLFYFVALFAVLILPIKVSAETVLDYTISNPDSEGVYTVEIFQKVGENSTYQTFDATIVAQHCIIKETSGTDTFIKSQTESTLDATGTSARIYTVYANGVINGTGQKVKVAEFKYIHDPSYTGTEEYKVTLSTQGSPDVIITEKTTENAKTGSALPYVGIAAGIILIGSAYIISRKSNKLYRM